MLIRPVHVSPEGEVTELDWRNRIVIPDAKKPTSIDAFQLARQELADRNISFTAPGEPFEVSLTGSVGLTSHAINRWDEGPLIAFDYHDSVDLTGGARCCLLSDKVIGVLKPRIFRDLEDYCKPVLHVPTRAISYVATLAADGAPPWTTTEPYERRTMRPDVPTELIAKKVKLVPGYTHRLRYQEHWQNGPRLDDPRPWDCHFSGTTTYGLWPIMVHRMSCLINMRVAAKRGRTISDERWLQWPEYVQQMYKTKIAPSPWGYGAVCFRDAEAVMFGAVLVKPDSSFCRTWPDLYDPDGNFYVRCRIDHADLPDIIDQVVDNWRSGEYYSMRERAWSLLAEACKPSQTADCLANALNSLMCPV